MGARRSKSLQWANLGVKPTQDWTEHHVIFNSQDKDLVTLYFGVWGAESGDLWWDDAAVEEVAFVNLVRRDGCPLVGRWTGRDHQRVRLETKSGDEGVQTIGRGLRECDAHRVRETVGQ